MLGLASEWRFEETESLIVAAQNQSIRTNLVKARTKSQGDSLCRVHRKVDEAIDHLVSGCSKLAQKEYKRRHDNLGKKYIHWKLARRCNFEAGDKWYEHEPESVLENEDYKILWDFSIQTDHVIEAQIPDLVAVDKREFVKLILQFQEIVGLRRRKIRQKNIKTWERSYRRYGMLKGRSYH